MTEKAEVVLLTIHGGMGVKSLAGILAGCPQQARVLGNADGTMRVVVTRRKSDGDFDQEP